MSEHRGECDFDDMRLPAFYHPEPRCSQCGKPRGWLEQNGCPESFRDENGTRVGCGRPIMTPAQNMKTDVEIRNAVIESVSIDDADRGMLTSWLQLDCGGSSQGFGGYSLYLPQSSRHHQLLSHAGHWIWRCMEIGGVARWTDLRGKTVRARIKNGLVEGIGHIVNDDWFIPFIDFAAQNKSAKESK